MTSPPPIPPSSSHHVCYLHDSTSQLPELEAKRLDKLPQRARVVHPLHSVTTAWLLLETPDDTESDGRREAEVEQLI